MAAALPNNQQPYTGGSGITHTERAIEHLRAELAESRQAADAACAGPGASSRECMVAHDIVEEISEALARKKALLAEQTGRRSPGPDPFGPNNPYRAQR